MKKAQRPFAGKEYEAQKLVPEEEADYGIYKYTALEDDFHQDVMSLLRSKKYKALPADSIPRIAARCYATYYISEAVRQGRVRVTSVRKS